jgi:hypothetical protein
MVEASHLTPTESRVLADVQRFRKSLRIYPGDAVPDLEPGVLNRDGEPVPGARAAECEQMPARLQHP